MSIPLHSRDTCRRAERDETLEDWIDERLREARIVVADVVHHSDHLIRMACKVLVQHGDTAAEREDARILLVILDARSPRHVDRHRTDPEVRR